MALAGEAPGAAATPAPPPPPPPRRRLDVAAIEGIDDLVAGSADAALLKSRDFPELQGYSVTPADVNVVLYDAYSVDSFAGCYGARAALGRRARFEGVDRATSVEGLDVEVTDRVVAMVGLCWSLEAMHDLVSECAFLFVLDTYSSVAQDLEQFIYPNVVRIIDTSMSAGPLAWNFFMPATPVPPLLRALEDAELGRAALRDAAAFALGCEEGLGLKAGFGEVQHDDKAFLHLEHLLDSGGRGTIERCAELGRQSEPEVQRQCLEATRSYAIRSLRAFPAFKCAVASAPATSSAAGRVAEGLVSAICTGSEVHGRAVGVVFEARGHRVRVTLRSMKGGADVSEVAAMYGGFGRQSRAFFTVAIEDWDEVWIQPEPMLWDVTGGLPLRHGELVTIMHRGERFPNAPADEWSWGYKTAEPQVEGWIPTLAHTLLLAMRAASSPGPGVRPLDEGDLLIARGQRGAFVWGTLFRHGHAVESTKGWYPRPEGLLQPVCAGNVRALLRQAGSLPANAAAAA